MRVAVVLCFCLLFAVPVVRAEDKNPANYPLRIHIFSRSETGFYHGRYMEEAKGEGRANLFQSGEPHAVDFNFDCSEKLRASFGYETYAAKWKKPGQELIVLMPVFGKSNDFWTCNLKTDVKDFAYMSSNGKMGSEPVAQYKTWMVKHNYDPESGKNTPTRNAPGEAGAPPASAMAPAAGGSPMSPSPTQ